MVSAGRQTRAVLVVDDNVDAADALAMVLDLEGHRTVAVYSAQGALERLAVATFDVVLLDIGLPDMDGYELARRIRQSGSHAGVRLVALTGYGQGKDRLRALEAGFDEHLVKPVDLSERDAVLSAESRRGDSHSG